MDLEVNARIRELRKNHGYSQEEFGKILGYKTSAYSQLERKGKIDTKLLKQICDKFNVDAMYILYGKNPEQPESPQQPIETEIIIGYKYGEVTISVMEMNLIEQIRRLRLKDIQQIDDFITKKISGRKCKTLSEN